MTFQRSLGLLRDDSSVIRRNLAIYANETTPINPDMPANRWDVLDVVTVAVVVILASTPILYALLSGRL